MKIEEISTLIVDDEEIWRMDLEDFAREAGLTDIDVVSSQPEAYELLEKKKYDLLISDTYYGSFPMGPNIVKKAVELSQKPVVIALSGANSEPWKELDYPYKFYVKDQFSVQDLKEVLQKELKVKF